MSESTVNIATAPASAQGGFRRLALPETLLVPLTSGRNIVIEEEHVRRGHVDRGQAIASTTGGFLPVAPASGTLVDVKTVQLTNGRRAPAAEIQVDPEQLAETTQTAEAPKDLPELIHRLSALGVWADRNTTPDFAGQLNAAAKRPVDLLVLNLLEADGAPLNAALMLTSARPILAAAGAVARALSIPLQIVGDADVVKLINAEIRRAPEIETGKLVELQNDYPQADPTILLFMLTGRRLLPGRLPVEKGVIMLDGAAALAVGRALGESRAMLDVPLVIRERGKGRVHLVSAAVGASISFVLEQLEMSGSDVIVRAGAALREVRIGVAAVVAGGELRLDIGPTENALNPDPCIRCGWCVEACPTRIHPAGLLEAAQQRDEDLAESFGIHACIECGICSYVCPSRLPLLEAIREIKRNVETR